MTWTQIRVDSETRTALMQKGTMGESFNDVLRRLLALPNTRTAAKRGPKAKVTKK